MQERLMAGNTDKSDVVLENKVAVDMTFTHFRG